MKKEEWYKLLGKTTPITKITAKSLAENRLLNEDQLIQKDEILGEVRLIKEDQLQLNEDKVDRVAGVVSSYLFRIANDIAAVTDLLDNNDTDEMKEKLIAALPAREPKDRDFTDAFQALDVMAAGKIAKWYRELAKNLKK